MSKEQLYKNNADSTVNSSIAVGATFFNVAAGHGSRFPAPGADQYCVVTLFEKNVAGVEINHESVKVTEISGDTLTVIRDFEGMVQANGGTSGGWAYPSAIGVNPSQVVYVQLRYTAYAAGNALSKDGNLAGIADAAEARGNLGLGNVNNTSDADKPVSNAQALVLAGKANSSHSHPISDTTGLQTALDGKSATGHTHTGTYEPADANIVKKNVANTFTASQKSGNVADNDGSFDLSGAGNNYTSTPTSAVAITFTNIAANAHKSGYIVLTNGANYAFTAHTNTKIATTDLAKIVLTGTYVLPYLCDGTDVMILGAWKKP